MSLAWPVEIKKKTCSTGTRDGLIGFWLPVLCLGLQGRALVSQTEGSRLRKLQRRTGSRVNTKDTERKEKPLNVQSLLSASMSPVLRLEPFCRREVIEAEATTRTTDNYASASMNFYSSAERTERLQLTAYFFSLLFVFSVRNMRL